MKSMRSIAKLAGVAVILLVASCGEHHSDSSTSGSGESDGPVRTVGLDMVDNAFEPAEHDVRQGETVRFELTNSGEVTHDAFVGDARAQEDHEREMREAEEDDNEGHMGPDEDDENGITLEPGETGELTYTFDQTGEIEVGCHEPGHYDSGMKVTVTVS